MSDSDSNILSSEKQDEILVDFDFFNFNSNDYGFVCAFLRPIFGDVAFFDNIVNSVIQSNGSTVKCGEETLAIISLIPMTEDLADFLCSKSKCLKSEYLEKSGILFCERLVNFPWTVYNHLYRLLVSETKQFPEHFLILCPVYPAKQKRKRDGNGFSFVHPEEEMIQKYADFDFDFPVSFDVSGHNIRKGFLIRGDKLRDIAEELMNIQ